jgi:uncharacterized damage-inducible protein DinB
MDPGALPALAAPIFALMQVQEDLARWTSGLTDEQVWLPIHGLTPLGFHLKHLAGSTRRLTAYLRGEQLTGEMLAELGEEKTPGMPLREMLLQLAAAFDEAKRVLRSVQDPEYLRALRFIGRKKIRVTLAGLAIHIGEHAQRHTGQAIVICQLLRMP